MSGCIRVLCQSSRTSVADCRFAKLCELLLLGFRRVSDVDTELEDLDYKRSRLQLDKEEITRKIARARCETA